MTLYDEFKKLMKGTLPDKGMLVPLFRWSSGNERNIVNCQKINKLFTKVDKGILNRMLVYGNMTKFPFKYPKELKDDKKIEFFFNDICSFYGWTRNELRKNWRVIDLEYLKEKISKIYAYDKKEKRIINKL